MPVGAAVAAVGVASSVYGNEESKKAQKKGGKKVQGTVEGYEAAQLGNIEQGYGEQERLLKQGNREELEGGEEAIQRFEGGGSQAIEDQSEKALGGIQSGASSRGLMGSSVQGNARLGVGRAASRSYVTLGEAVSQMRTNLANKKAAGTNRLGALKGFKAQAKNNVLAQSVAMIAGYQGNVQYGATQPALGGLGALAGYAQGGGFNKGGSPGVQANYEGYQGMLAPGDYL